MFVVLMLFIPIVVPVFWRWDWIGGFFFVGLALLFVVSEWVLLSENWWFVKAPTIALLLLPGILFLLNWHYRGSLSGIST